ncbi:MAG: aldo/keto reductase [Spirochaetales bacterium]|nr:aldo/keto reductase [Spirochaetales bacterium]
MNYKQFGRLEFDVSVLGFGAMRFPEKEGKIDEQESTKMIHSAIEHGVNYIDTAWPYHKEMSELFLGNALKKGYRDKVKIATKLPCWFIEKQEDCDTYLNNQLKRLKTDHIDFYLLHGLFSSRWEQVLSIKMLDWAKKAIKDGRIENLGFSFHGTYSLFADIIDYYDWDFCQIQYNYMNEDFQAGTKGLEYAYKNEVPVVIMEPLLGGLLANPQGKIKKIWDASGLNPVDVAFRWLWNKKEVTTVLSGMSSLKQLEQNINLADKPDYDKLTIEENKVIEQVVKAYKELNPVPCTQCEYCLPCPQGVNIPRNFNLYNQAVIYDHIFLGKSHYNWHTEESARAGACIQCGECEEKCPQNIKISELMPKIHEALLFKEGEV